LHRLWRNPGFLPQTQLPDFAALHPGCEGVIGCLTFEYRTTRAREAPHGHIPVRW
jgi:hypothetical protein